MKLAYFLGFVDASTRRLPALALAALAGAGFIACSDSNKGRSEEVATTQAALSGGTDPVVRYAFNESSGTLASDSSGNGHSATLVNGATFVAGARGNAGRINGGTQRVDLPPGVVQRCDDLTIAARVNLAANSANWTRIFDIGANTNSYMFLTPRAGAANILRFGITTSGGAGEQLISHTFTFPTNSWKHVAVVLSGNTGTMYLDGVQVAQNTNLTLNPSALGATANNWLGDSQFAADPTLNGSIDDFLVSCRPYSAAEVAWLANGTDPVAQYTFNETSGTTAADSSGNARNATLANGASFVTGLHGNAVQIAGGTQRVNLPTGVVQSCTDLTIAAHVRLATNSANWAHIFDIGASTTSYMFLTPRAGAANILRFAITTGGSAAEQRLSSTITFPTNTWKHVAVTLSGNTGTMYLDGVQVAQNTSLTLNPNALGATANNWLGDSQFSADPTLNGTVDNLTISCRAFSPAEIGSLAGACTSAANCNDGNACTADSCSNGFCSRSKLTDGTACANATVCDGAETCQNGFCAAGTAPVVDDGNACTTDACDPVQGVKHTPITGGACGGSGGGGAGGSSGSGSGAMSGGGGTSGSAGGVTCPAGTTAVEMFIELPPGVSRNTIALGSYGTPLDIHDRVRVLATSTTFASVSSLTSIETNPTRLGVEAHVQDLWAEPRVELRDRSHVHGDVRSPGTVTPLAGAVIDGQTVQQTLTPRRRESWLVCHPNTHQGNIDVQPSQTFPSATTRLNPGAWGTLAVKSGARLRLRGAATYYFESMAIESGAIIDLDTAAGGTQLYFRNGGFFRGTQARTDSRPNVLFGSENGNFTIGGSFNGTVVAPRGVVDLPTVSGGVHRGSFFGALVVAHQAMDIFHEPVDTTGMCPANAPCNGLCPCTGGGGGRGQCHSDGDCQPGNMCTANNGACFGTARADSYCWPEQCTDGIELDECGTADSPCGSVCGCGIPCDAVEGTGTCPAGEQCIHNFGRALEIESRDACGPTGPTGCPSNDSERCGEEFSLCGRHCICTPDCSHATPENPGDGCGGNCPEICPTGRVGCCAEDLHCQAGAVCLTDPNGARTCRPQDLCENQALRPPLCGSSNAPCGATCPICTPQCGGRECGSDPNCGASCGTCGSGEQCDAAGHCTSPFADSPVTVPDGNGGQRVLADIPPAPASGVGAIPGSFSVSDQGTAQYAIPINVPPGRLGMEPALKLIYQASRDTGSVGIGWRLEGLPKITRCPKMYALDGYAAAVRNDPTDRFCLDGKRLMSVRGPDGVVGEYGASGTEYRTLIDSFAKITSLQESGDGPQLDLLANFSRAERQQQGPDSFEVRSKDGRIMTFGGTVDSLVMNRDGIRQAWLLRRVEDRASNTILYAYDNVAAHLASSKDAQGRLPNMLQPSVISYTGHGDSAGNREVRMTYETRSDPSMRFLQGGVAWALEERLKRITTYVDGAPVKSYQLVYSPNEFSQLSRVFECEGVTEPGQRCNAPTSFTYERSPGFEHVTPGPGALVGGQLDVDGNGLADYLETDVKVQGVAANLELAAAQIAVDVAIGVGTSFLTPAVGMSISQVWSMLSTPFWGIFAEEPKVKIRHFIYMNKGIRGANFEGGDTSGVPCDFANAFLDWDRDGWDDILSACPDGDSYRLKRGTSNGNGRFTPSSTILSVRRQVLQPARNNGTRRYLLRPPAFYDVDGDSLQDMVSCKDLCSLEVRLRKSPSEGFSEPFPVEPASCTPNLSEGKPEPFCGGGGHTIFDIDGDGTPDLLSAKANGGWHVLRFTRTGDTPEAKWKNVDFPDVSLSSLGDNLQVVDLNSDGLSDVLRVDPTTFSPITGQRNEGRNTTIWLNSGNGHFAQRSLRHTIPDGRDLRTIAIADYNDDGRLDWIEHWKKADRAACGSALNLVRQPNSGFTALEDKVDPPDFGINLGCNNEPQSATIDLAADFDGDGSMDLHGSNDVFYGRGAHNLLLRSIDNGLGFVTSVEYDKATTDSLPTYESTCAASWPEMCLKRMSGLVAEHTEGLLPAASGASPIVQRSYRYTYSNARMSTTGHGWLGFQRRTIRETTGQVPPPPLDAPTDSEFASTTTTIEMEPVVRYMLIGLPATVPVPPYVYPFAGLPKATVTDQSRQASPLETTAHRRRTRVENTWRPRMSAGGMLYPIVESRATSVFDAPQSAPLSEDGSLLTRCNEGMVTDPYGNLTRHTQTCNGEFRETTTAFTPDPSTWLISNPNRVTVTSARDAEQSRVVGFGYFPNGLLESVVRSPDGLLSERHATVLARNAFGNVETMTEFVETGEASRATSVIYDADNVFPHLITNAKNQTTEVVFDKRWGAPKTMVDPNGVALQHGYDGLGLLFETRDPTGVTTYSYSRSARELPATPVGHLSPRTRVVVEHQGSDGTRSGGSSQEFDYRGLPVLSTIEGFAGAVVVSERAYDTRGRLLAATTPRTADSIVIPRTFYSYDGLDRLKRITQPDGSPVEVRHASSASIASQFLPWFRRVGCTDSGFPQFACPTEIEQAVDEEGKRNVVLKDYLGLVLRSIDGENVDAPASTIRAVDYHYGAFGQLEEIRHNAVANGDPLAPLTVFSHDPFGRLLAETDPDSGTTSYTYNGFDELKTSFDPKQQRRTHTYDDLGRITSIVDPAGTTSWIYDQGVNALGRLSEAISPATSQAPLGQRLVYTYEPVSTNNRGLLKRVEYIIDSSPYPVDFTYDAHGRASTIRYPHLGSGPPIVAKYSYDDFGFLKELKEVGSGTDKPVWLLNGAFQGQLVAQEIFGDDTYSNYSYNPARHFLETIDTHNGIEFIQNLEYTHYKNGQVFQRFRDTTQSRTHYYDALNRLSVTFDTTAPGDPGLTTPYNYDHLGNMTQRGANTLAYNATKQRHLTSVASNTYLYDFNGNVRERRGPQIPGSLQTIEYTPFDLPGAIVNGIGQGAKTTTFEYSADEERLVRRDRGPSIDRTRHFVTDLYQRLVDNLASTTTEERFRLYAGGREVAQIVRENGVDKTLYFHADALGTPDTITTSAGEVIHQEFDAFGSEIAGPNTEITRSGFTGHEHDRDLGLVDMKGRVYDPLAGRFATQDPIVQAPYWSQGLNRYAYTFNDPVNNIDPSGFQNIAANAAGFVVDLDAVSAPGGFVIDLDPSFVPSTGATSASSVPAAPSKGAGIAPAAGLVATAVNVATKALSGQYGQKSTPNSHSNGPSGRGAENTRPAKAGSQAAANNKPVDAPTLRDVDREFVDSILRAYTGGGPDWTEVLSTNTECFFSNCHIRHPNMSTPGNARSNEGISNIWRMTRRGGEQAAAAAAPRVTSRIGLSAKLAREAEAAGRAAQRSLDHLTSELARGNLNPGIGTKSLGRGISYARARDGARVFFRQGADGGVEILGKATKANETAVIDEVLRVFGQ